MRTNRRKPGGPIGWARARAIFGEPQPPKTVIQQRGDRGEQVFLRLARTSHEWIDFKDLSQYQDDFAYGDLQPDLFNYLFPACLMHWHASLMENKACGHADFHHGIRKGNVLEKMVQPERRNLIYEFFRDSFLERLDMERGFVYTGSRTPAYGWIMRFNSVGLVMPRIDLLWNSWWSLDTPGRAVAALQYCSGLMYFEEDNPVFGAWTKEGGGGGPYLWENDSLIYDAGWKPENLDFLSKTLTVEFVEQHVEKAVARLEGEPEGEKARQLLEDLPERRELVALRVAELPLLLAERKGPGGWSV